MTQRVVMITGGAQGLGAEIVCAFVEQGDIAIIVDRNVSAGVALETELAMQGTALFMPIDIQDDSAIDTALKQVIARFGRVDVLVNNACVYEDAGLASSREQWQRSLSVNVVSAAVMAQKVVPFMTEGSVIINMGSIGGKTAAVGRMLYPVSKAAMLHLTKSLAVEVAPKGIRAVAVSPAWTWSPALAGMAGEDRELADKVGAVTHPLGRVGNAREIADVVCFIASVKASWITGVDIPVDGGFSILGPDQGKGPRHWFNVTQ
ncbi:MAG: SDR family oxidoreductase [Paenalcaligenes sp.]